MAKLSIDEDTLLIVLDALVYARDTAEDNESYHRFDTLSIRLSKEIREAKNPDNFGYAYWEREKKEAGK